MICFYVFLDFGGKNCIGDFVQELQCNGPTPVQTKNDTQLCYSEYEYEFFLNLTYILMSKKRLSNYIILMECV